MMMMMNPTLRTMTLLARKRVKRTLKKRKMFAHLHIIVIVSIIVKVIVSIIVSIIVISITIIIISGIIIITMTSSPFLCCPLHKLPGYKICIIKMEEDRSICLKNDVYKHPTRSGLCPKMGWLDQLKSETLVPKKGCDGFSES